MYTNATCSMCKASEQLFKKINPEIKLTKVSIDTEPDLMSKLMAGGIRSLPVISFGLTDAKAASVIEKSNELLASHKKSFQKIELPDLGIGLEFHSLV